MNTNKISIPATTKIRKMEENIRGIFGPEVFELVRQSLKDDDSHTTLLEEFEELYRCKQYGYDDMGLITDIAMISAVNNGRIRCVKEKSILSIPRDNLLGKELNYATIRRILEVPGCFISMEVPKYDMLGFFVIPTSEDFERGFVVRYLSNTNRLLTVGDMPLKKQKLINFGYEDKLTITRIIEENLRTSDLVPGIGFANLPTKVQNDLLLKQEETRDLLAITLGAIYKITTVRSSAKVSSETGE